MPMSATCRNCGLAKTPDYYSENYCKSCTDAIEKANELSAKEGTDRGAARREALASCAHSVHNNHIDPRRPVTRNDYWSPDLPETL